MDASDQSCRLFDAHGSLHDLLGGGAVADVLLWRRREVAGGLLAAVVLSWVLFYWVPGYTLISFVSRVILIVLAVLFLWAKAARSLNRAPPPVPLLKISEDSANAAAAAVGTYMNKALQVFENITLGKDSSLFYKVASVLLLTSIIGRLTDLITLVYASLVIVLTIPVLVENSEEHIARFLKRLATYAHSCGQGFEGYKSQIENRIFGREKMC